MEFSKQTCQMVVQIAATGINTKECIITSNSYLIPWYRFCNDNYRRKSIILYWVRNQRNHQLYAQNRLATGYQVTIFRFNIFQFDVIYCLHVTKSHCFRVNYHEWTATTWIAVSDSENKWCTKRSASKWMSMPHRFFLRYLFFVIFFFNFSNELQFQAHHSLHYLSKTTDALFEFFSFQILLQRENIFLLQVTDQWS